MLHNISIIMNDVMLHNVIIMNDVMLLNSLFLNRRARRMPS